MADPSLYRITKFDPRQPNHKDVRYGGRVRVVQVIAAAKGENAWRRRMRLKMDNRHDPEYYLPVTVQIERASNVVFDDVTHEFVDPKEVYGE